MPFAIFIESMLLRNILYTHITQVAGGCQYGWVCCWDARARGEAGRLVSGQRHEDPVCHHHHYLI